MEERTPIDAIRNARDLARTASHLAYEAATLAQLFQEHGAREASLVAAQASIQAAKRAFQVDDIEARRGASDLEAALALALETLDDAQEAVQAAKLALDAALAYTTRTRLGGDAGATSG